MMNYIAINFTNYLVNSNGPLRQGSTLPATPMVAPSARLPVMISGTRLTGGFFVAALCAVAFYVFLWKTRVGYKIRAVGYNPMAAECGGIKTTPYTIMAMMLAGAFAGTGGAVEIIGIHGRFYANFSPGYGFEGVAVSMLGANHPFGIILSALLFGALKTGAMAMQIRAGTNAELVKVLQALVIFFIAGKWSMVKWFEYSRSKTKKDDTTAASSQGGYP
jgi:simple sugar transport system permease protein